MVILWKKRLKKRLEVWGEIKMEDITKAPELITVTVSKSGRNLYAHIPSWAHKSIARGDKVAITVIERANLDPKIIKEEVKKFVNNPNGEKLKGKLIGYDVSIPLAKIVKAMSKTKAEKLFYEAIVG